MAEAVAAVCLVRGLVSDAALAHFLAQRTAAIAAFAAAPATAPPGASPRTPAEHVKQLITHCQETAAMVQTVLLHALLLFGDDDPLGLLSAPTPCGAAPSTPTAARLRASKTLGGKTKAHAAHWAVPGQPLGGTSALGRQPCVRGAAV
jgi:hypothetical protein